MSPLYVHLCLSTGLALLVSGCQRAAATPVKPAVPSKVTGAVKEDQLATVELTEAAEARLGIETATIEIRSLPQHRTFGGEVTLLTDAEGQIQQAKALVEQRRIDLERAELQNEKGVGLKATLDTAKAQMIQSQKALEAALTRKGVLDAWLDGESTGEQKPLMIESPQSGIIRAMNVMPGEFVMAGSVLFEVMNIDRLWIRVPVYVGEVAQVAVDQAANVGDLAFRAGQLQLKAEPIAAPPTATALASTVDLYYELTNTKGTLRPGQRVSVELPLVGSIEQRVIPWSAVVHDIYGGAWIYEKIADHKFARRRVQVKQVIDTWAVLDQGPPVGTTIVVTGVAEVFGTEFWVQK